MLDRVIILHDNACLNIVMLVMTVFQKYGSEVLNHPLYSPNLSTFIDFKCGSKCNMAYLSLVIMKKI